MAALDPGDDGNDLRSQFLNFMRRSLERSLELMASSDGPLPLPMVTQALHVVCYALDVPAVWPTTCQLVLALAPRMERDGWREELRALLEAALDVSRKRQDGSTEAELCWHLGILHHLQARHTEARAYLETSAAQYAGLGALRDQARALDRLAQTAQRQNRLTEAEQLLDQARRLLAAGDPEHAYRLLTLGGLALTRRQWHRARVHSMQVLCLLQTSEDWRLLAWACVNLGVAHVQLQQYQEGMAWYHRSIELFDRIGDPVHRALAALNLGVIFAMTGQPAAALVQYAQAEPVFRRTADVRRLAMVYNNIGYAQGQQERWAEAEAAYRLAVQYHKESGNLAGRVDSLDNLAQSLEALGRAGEATVVLRQALDALATLPADAGYPHLSQMVTAHLASLEANG
jgi:tetratricopeptide (TPR) repeat protein